MPMSTHIHEAPVRVRYAETDAAGMAHHSAYAAWLEVGRVEWLRSLGVAYGELERSGYTLPVVELRTVFVAPARFDDELLVRTGLVEARSRSLRFVYEVVTSVARPRQLANGSTRHVCLRQGAISPLPDALRALLA
jgi:acyl-CoA thioester hydrolase